MRASGDLGRSDTLVRLFDFLLERSLAGQAPGEIEIAQDVFNKTSNFDVMLDASVRVYIHRLRRKLSEHYARAGEFSERISIPLGEYRMVLETPQIEVPPAEPGTSEVPPSARRLDRVWIALAALLLVNALAWFLFANAPKGDANLVNSNLWKPIYDSGRPTIVILGDYYVFGEAPDGVTVTRLTRDFSINSREDLDAWLMTNPDKVGRNIDVDLHYLPQSIGPALRSLLPTINAVSSTSGQRPPVESMSNLKADVFKAANIVYIGYLSGMGDLQEPVFRASGFKIGADFDELVDEASGRHYRSDWGALATSDKPHRDYGYIASLLGPSGNRIIIIAGTRDPALAQMAEIAADPKQLESIDAKSGSGAFEAFFEVQTLGNLNVGSTLIVARPVRGGAIWRP